jgi:uncharacterized membrane protein (UPF0182 family)
MRTIRNIRLWDESPSSKPWTIQQIRTYYKFTSIENDRYTVVRQYLQVMLSARELSYDDLPSNHGSMKNWSSPMAMAFLWRMSPE